MKKRKSVDIETEWNLKEAGAGTHRRRETVDIETEWNLKKKAARIWLKVTGRYRNRVEFKGSCSIVYSWGMAGRYRNRVEFKVFTFKHIEGMDNR